jgi:hypothetical protein
VRHVVELQNHFVVRDYGGKPRVGWFNAQNEFFTMSFDDFKNAHREKKMDVTVDPKKPKLISLVDHWLEHPLTTRYDKVDYRVGIPQSDMGDVLNLWRGWPVGLRPGWDDYHLTLDGPKLVTDGPFDGPLMPERYCDLFLDHMKHNMCGGDDDVFTYLLGWIADALWNPGPSETAVVLTGPQGSGKSLWAQFIMEFFGIHSITLDDPEQLTGKFNAHLQNKSFVFADEAFFSGNRAHAAKLKTLVTKRDILIEPKNVNAFVAPKYFRLALASNDEHVIRAERDDRRNLVLRVDAGENNQNQEYFGRMRTEWETGGRRALFRWLTGAYWGSAVGEKRFRTWKRPVTAALQTQKDMSLSKPLLAVFNMLRDGDASGPYHLDSTNGKIFVSTVAITESGRLGAEHQRSVGDILAMLAGDGARSTREYVGEGAARRQYRGFWLPPLPECRRRWEVHFGRIVAWPEAVASWIDRTVPQHGNPPF